MVYAANITTVKNTPATSLKRTVLSVTKGLVYKVEFYFPSGSAGLMGAAVFDGGFQCWPSSLGQFFTSDNETISFDDMYLKNAAPFQFDILTYNTDDTYDHVMGVRVGLVSKDVFLARFLPHKTYEYLAELLEKMSAERTALAEIQAAALAESPYQWLERQLEELG